MSSVWMLLTRVGDKAGSLGDVISAMEGAY